MTSAPVRLTGIQDECLDSVNANPIMQIIESMFPLIDINKFLLLYLSLEISKIIFNISQKF